MCEKKLKMAVARCILLLLTGATLTLAKGNLDVVYQWRYMDFLYNSPEERAAAIKNGSYDFSHCLPMDVAKARDGRVFVTMIGFLGVPARLATVSDVQGPSGPLLKPYPDWSWFARGNCEGITSVYRVAIDKCDRLWVLDTGVIEGSNETNCQPQLLAFDLNTDQLIKRVKIPGEIALNSQGIGILTNPIVETEGPACEKTTVYMADTFGPGLVVWTDETKFARYETKLFEANEQAFNVTVANLTIPLNAGLLGMALSPINFPGEPHFLYLRPLASFDLYAIKTGDLKQKFSGDKLAFQGGRNILSSQSIGQAFSADGTLFMGMTKESAIACWNRYTEMTRDNFDIVAQDPKTMQYVNEIKITIPSQANPEEELWAISNKFTHFQAGQLDADDYNFRILAGSVRNLVADSKCRVPKKLLASHKEISKDDGNLILN